MAPPLETRWLNACLAPADIAPHPNFAEDEVQGPDLLGLLVQAKWRDYGAFRTSDVDSPTAQEPLVEDLLTAARLSMTTGTVEEGVDRLADILADQGRSFGQRAAAGLLFALGCGELDQPARAIAPLEDLANDLVGVATEHTASRNLLRAVLLQQCALRCLDSGDRERAAQFAQWVLECLPTSEPTSSNAWESYRVSRGIEWGAAESQYRIQEAVRSSALSALVTTGRTEGAIWQSLVRSPYPTGSVRRIRDEVAALESLVGDSLKSRLPEARRVMSFGSGVADRHMYAALVNAEMSGDAASVRRLREVAGRVASLRFLESRDDHSLGEALRLMRQANDKDTLRQFVKLLRLDGPIEELQRAASSLIERRSATQACTESDFALICKSADLLSPSRLMRALDLAFLPGSDTGSAAFSRASAVGQTEELISRVQQLVSGTEDAAVHAYALDLLNASEDVGRWAGEQRVYQRLAALTESLRWSQLSHGAADQWAAFLETEDSPSGPVVELDRVRALYAVDPALVGEARNRLQGMELAAAVAGGLFGNEPPPWALERSSSAVAESLQEARLDAGRGTYSGYWWSPFTIAGILVRKFGQPVVWRELLACLLDNEVAGESKYEALRELSEWNLSEPIPPLLPAVADMPSTIPASDSGFFPVSAHAIRAVYIRFLAAYEGRGEAQCRDEMLPLITSSDATARMEIANACTQQGLVRPSSEWARLLLLNLSSDPDQDVVAAAARGLAALLSTQGALNSAIEARVLSLLTAPGISRPLATLKGLKHATASTPITGMSSDLTMIIDRLATEHPSDYVRRLARAVSGNE